MYLLKMIASKKCSNYKSAHKQLKIKIVMEPLMKRIRKLDLPFNAKGSKHHLKMENKSKKCKIIH